VLDTVTAMTGLTVTTTIETRLSWQYDKSGSPLESLYRRATAAQWDADRDIDWTQDVPFGERLPDDSPFAMAAFESSPLARRGRAAWDAFRWEVQCWMVSQFLHGEQGALVVAGRLVEAVPGLDAKAYAASQAGDEARHVAVFSRYLREKTPQPYPVTASLERLLVDILADSRWDVTALGMQIIVEALAMAAFRLADRTFHDDLIKHIARLVARDEARHVSFGVLSLASHYRELTAAERADREDLVLDAASLMRRRFLLEDVWDRLDVDRASGVAFAATNDLMVMYRRTMFSRIVPALARVGLLTARVRTGLAGLDLWDPARSGPPPRGGEGR
jgi:hypothetical protein